MSNPLAFEVGLGLVLSDAAKRSAGLAVDQQPKRTVTQDIETLKAAAVRYAGPTPFAPGDLVTPRADSPLENAGKPHIVLEADEFPNRDLSVFDPSHVNSVRYGAKLDIRVASTCSCGHGEVRAFWEESWMFEPYVEAAAEIAAPSEAA